MADLALSFPTLLFALAAPRRGLDPARAIERAIDGAPLAEVAAAAEVPLWLRRLPPEAASRPIAKLPDSKFLRHQMANHLPSPKDAAIWLQAVSDTVEVTDETIAVWIAAEIARDAKSVDLDQLRLVTLWAWFSRRPETFGYGLIQNPWTPEVRSRSALEAAREWRASIRLHASLGRAPVTDLWLQPARVGDYDFEPLASASAIAEEATAMGNCLRTYGNTVALNRSRLWSMRKGGRRVATLCITFRDRDPLPELSELKAAKNADAPIEAWRAARQWLVMHDSSPVDPKPRNCAPLDRATWLALWRPYWLAKRRLPKWLPLTPSIAALYEL